MPLTRADTAVEGVDTVVEKQFGIELKNLGTVRVPNKIVDAPLTSLKLGCSPNNPSRKRRSCRQEGRSAANEWNGQYTMSISRRIAWYPTTTILDIRLDL
jgi:hypothetical protein